MITSRPGRMAPSAAAAALALAIALGVTGALASGSPPRFLLVAKEAYPTRLRATMEFLPEGSEAESWIEYSTSEAGPWTLVRNGRGGGDLVLGAENPGEGPAEPSALRHLTPDTTYFVRFRGRTTNGESSETIPLKTLPVAAPEIAQRGGVNNFPPRSGSSFTAGGTVPSLSTSLSAQWQLESNGAETHYELASSPSSASGPYTTCASGAVSVAEEFAFSQAACTSLAPETTYFLRLRVQNEKGEASETLQLKTATAKPQMDQPSVRNATGDSAYFTSSFIPHGSESHWRVELASAPGGPWSPVSGASGTVSQSQAEALEARRAAGKTFGAGVPVAAHLTGLASQTSYYVRLFAENQCASGCGEAVSPVLHFSTFGAPLANTLVTHAVHEGAVRVLADLNPDSAPTSPEQAVALEGAPTGGTFTLTFAGKTTEPIPYNASAEAVELALADALNGGPFISVQGPDGGPYRLWFASETVAVPPVGADGSGLTPSGSISVATVQQGGEAYDTHYHFEYLSDAQYKAQGERFLNASSTPTVDLGSGDSVAGVGSDVPALSPGETYRYRLVATNDSPGNPVVDGGEQQLTVPSPAIEPTPACPNETLRTGPSGHLPDCRAFEQISPIDKEGAQEAFSYGITKETGADVGEDGEHIMFMSEATRWGTHADSGQDPYLLSRLPAGWAMTAGAPQPQTGFNLYRPQVFNPDATEIALRSQWTTGAGEPEPGNESSPNIEFKTGRLGGPYVTVASLPRSQAGGRGDGWVAASEDFSKLILAVPDRTLVEGHNTATKQGNDLYEYSAGVLAQANVDSEGHTIGSCGATMVLGREGWTLGQTGSTRHALSTDGSRAFFEAVPNGAGCGETSNLYMREASARRTLDIGPYRFAGGNAQGSELLLESKSAGEVQYLVYHLETGALKPIFSLPTDVQSQVVVSRDFGAIYILTPALLPGTGAVSTHNALEQENIYRYDIADGTLSYVVRAQAIQNLGVGGTNTGAGNLETTPDGRFLYFRAERVAGLPGGAVEPNFTGIEVADSRQLFRYDSREHSIECASCASPFDPDPRFGIENSGGSLSTEWATAGQPQTAFVSPDGRYAFFETPAALVKQDVNGEAPFEGIDRFKGLRPGGSPSNDVYEWRAQGVTGCEALQGCLSLITPGTQDGWLVVLLGTAADGRDVIFYTSQQLLPQDRDGAGDIYDARVGGGIPEASSPTECEGDACSTPAAAPNDATPSSVTFSGTGNLTAPLPSAPAHPASPAAKPKCPRGKRAVRKGRRVRCIRATRHQPRSARGGRRG